MAWKADAEVKITSEQGFLALFDEKSQLGEEDVGGTSL